MTRQRMWLCLVSLQQTMLYCSLEEASALARPLAGQAGFLAAAQPSILGAAAQQLPALHSATLLGSLLLLHPLSLGLPHLPCLEPPLLLVSLNFLLIWY